MAGCGGSSCGVFLSWRDLTVKVDTASRGGSRYLLHSLTGYAEPGSLLAIMGSSGCGKTTLLNVLAGRLGNATLERGEILANGTRQQLSYGNSAYVTQDDLLIATLTLYETMLYSAHLQLPGSMSNFEKQQRVHCSIQEMGLQHCADTRVGGWNVQGLSGGEKRRLSIAIETLRHPPLLFLDEPTSGLDSAAAFHVVKRLRALARAGRTIIASIHQPSSEAFGLFDLLGLLSAGKTVYFGERIKAQKFYEDAGFPCPAFRNPSDHFLWVIDSNFEEINYQDIEMEETSKSVKSGPHNVQLLIKAYTGSDMLNSVIMQIQKASTKKGDKLKGGSPEADFFNTVFYLTSRSFTNMRRDYTYYWFRLLVYVLLSIVLGTVYYKVGLSYAAIQARAAMLMFITSFLSFIGVLSFPSFIEDMKIFTRERLNGHYGVAAFAIANTLSSFPFLILIALIPGAVVYILGGLHPGLDRFCYFFLTLLGCLSAVEGLLMITASMVPDFLSGMMAGSGIMGMYLLSGGFFRLLNDLPKPLWRYPVSYISFNTWTNKAFYNNDFIGLEFESNVAGGLPLKGEDVVRTMFQMHISYSKWWLIFVLVCMAMCYRIIFFFSMKLRERIPTIIGKFRSGKVVQMIENATSGRFVTPYVIGGYEEHLDSVTSSIDLA